MERMKRLAAAVPDDVELGFHLCYGDLDARHFVEPANAAKMVELGNLICAAVKRPIAWLHMPVPAARDDDAFFQPLRDLVVAKDELEMVAPGAGRERSECARSCVSVRPLGGRRRIRQQRMVAGDPSSHHADHLGQRCHDQPSDG
jgi:hypothetical protein